MSPGQFLGAPTHADIIKFNIKLIEILEQNCVWRFYYFNLERSYDVLKSKNPCILLNNNINFNKIKMES